MSGSEGRRKRDSHNMFLNTGVPKSLGRCPKGLSKSAGGGVLKDFQNAGGEGWRPLERLIVRSQSGEPWDWDKVVLL